MARDEPRLLTRAHRAALPRDLFDLDLPAELVGFMAAISGALADAGVPLLAVCGYTKDHLLVREEHLDAALGRSRRWSPRFASHSRRATLS